MFVNILGRRWNLLFARLSEDRDGDCDAPNTKGKSIRVSKKVRGMYRLEVIIHECLHAALPSWDEHHISQLAKDLARILWRIGYRADK